MPRKSDQQLTLEEQHRFWMGKLRKARTLQQQVIIQKIITGIEAKLWPDPAQEAREAARAAKLQMKAQKIAAAQTKKAEEAELERLKEIERQKVRSEANPVLDHFKRAVIRAKIAEERTALNHPLTAANPKVVMAVESTTEQSITADAPPADGGVVSPEMEAITRAAEQSAKRQSSTTRADVDFFERVMKPLEPRDVIAPVQRQYEGCDFDPIRQEVAPPAEPVDEGSYLAEWNWVPKKW